MSDDNSASTQEKQRPAHWWKPGVSPNPAGRPKGARNKLGEEFVAALQADFNKHGVSAIERVRTDKPDAYLKVIASILPKELTVNTNALGDMSDDELAAVLSALRALADTVNPALAGAGAGEAHSPQPPKGLSPIH